MRQYDFKKEYDQNGRESVVIENQSRRRLDLVPRLVCLVFAIIIWIYCVNINENDVVTTFTVKLNVIGGESMSDGMSVYSTGNVSEIKMTVQGTNRDINKYTASDYSASIDVSSINSVGWSTLKIQTTIPENSTLKLLSTDIDTVSVYADVSAEREVPMSITQGSITQPSNYKLDYKIDGDIDKIMIKGPKSLIDKISKAEYLLEGEFNKSKDISGFALNFYNENGEQITSGNSDNVSTSAISYDTSKMKIIVSVTAPAVLKIRAVGNNPSYNYAVDAVTANVVGDPEMLSGLPDYIIDMENRDIGVHQVSLKAEELGFPDGVRLEDEQIYVIVRITEKVTPAKPQE